MDLLNALGAIDAEVERGARLYKAALAEQDQAKRDADQPDWWLRSGYADQVRDIAPAQLLGRQGEMDELHAWCAGGGDAYVRWEAGPRAGKSALMAWLVLHPPPGTWVISFFVSASLNTQADSAAYTDCLLDQLPAITGDQVPSSASPGQRDQLRRQMLEKAADRAARAGKRLVLVVDGLDEDCGSLPGSGLASIAACLPSRPASALRVIVAARPDPPLPASVAWDHPLRGCRIRALDASPYAARVVDLAQQELDLVVATHKSGLGYQVLGLVAASGGGLEDRDLQQLTQQDASSIETLLHGTFGRTIAARADPRTKIRTLQFTHDTLRKQATGRLGSYMLAVFAERLHSWADGYQRRGWPPDTPVYLLHGYARMLADAGDLDRLAALAIDRARHDRMLSTTGGDSNALAEIAAAHALIGTAQTADLLAALRLAWHRDQLAYRNSRIPNQLPAVWAALGQPLRAEALARSLPSQEQQAEALVDVARATAAAGDHDHAEQIARSLPEPARRAQVLAVVAGAAAAAGDRERVRMLTDDAEQIARSLPEPDDQARALAKAACAVGDYECARRLARAAELITRTIPYLFRAWVLADVAGAVAAAGDHDRAEQIARSLPEPWQSQALADVAGAVAAARDHDHAEQIARSLREPDGQARVLAVVAGKAAAAGSHDCARRLAGDAEQIARSMPDQGRQRVLSGVAGAVAAAGDHEHAEQIAWSLRDWWQAQAVADVAGAVAAAGDYDRAEQIARSVGDPARRAGVLADVAGKAAAAGSYDCARRLAGDAEQIARSIPDLWQVRAVADVARAAAAAARPPVPHRAAARRAARRGGRPAVGRRRPGRGLRSRAASDRANARRSRREHTENEDGRPADLAGRRDRPHPQAAPQCAAQSTVGGGRVLAGQRPDLLPGRRHAA